MGLNNDLEKEVATIFRTGWAERDGTVVPDDDSVTLGNDAVNLEATVLYADLADSTWMVDSKITTYSAEIYKTFLVCAAKVIRSQGGTITAYDGDRVMAVYIGGSKNTNAVKSAMKIQYAVDQIINPAQNRRYSDVADDPVRVTVGVDTSSLMVAKTGVRGANDLVWVGRAANYAAKLSALSASYIYITEDIYNHMHEEVRTSSDGDWMWEPAPQEALDHRLIYRSSWWWRID